MGKSKGSGNRQKYTSQGMIPTVSRQTRKAMKRSRTEADKLADQIQAWEEGRNPWITVEQKGQKLREKFVKVRTNDYWGSPKNRGFYNPQM